MRYFHERIVPKAYLFQMVGGLPWSKNRWKIISRMGANSLCWVWITIGLSWSGPDAL